MVSERGSPAVFRFGAFDVDIRTKELRKQGVRVKIQEQPFQVLVLLLQRPGDVVTREELRSQIWRSDTFVDFDNGLNTSINRLREALGDSAGNPLFVETIPRRGYRFIAPVTTNGAESPVPLEGPSARSPRTRRFLAATAILVIAVLLAGWLLWRWRQAHRLTEKDILVLADFINTTGDPVFDGALRQGLAVQPSNRLSSASCPRNKFSKHSGS